MSRRPTRHTRRRARPRPGGAALVVVACLAIAGATGAVPFVACGARPGRVGGSGRERAREAAPGTAPRGEDEEEEEGDGEREDGGRGGAACGVTSLDACPARGCALEGSGEALANEHKRMVSAATLDDAVALDFDLMRALERSAERRVPSGEVPSPAARAALARLDLDVDAADVHRGHAAGARGRVEVGEGAPVRIAGYLAGVRASGAESVNCRLRGAANNDLHLELVPEPADPPERGIVVEMIPQGRPPEWTVHALAALVRARVQVLVVGSLFYDSRHRVNASPPWLRGEPRRFTLWEVHPVTELYRCAAAPCSANRTEGWVAVGRIERPR